MILFLSRAIVEYVLSTDNSSKSFTLINAFDMHFENIFFNFESFNLS